MRIVQGEFWVSSIVGFLIENHNALTTTPVYGFYSFLKTCKITYYYGYIVLIFLIFINVYTRFLSF